MARYYLTHPRITGQVIKCVLQEGSLQRVRMKIGQREYRLGNYPVNADRLPETQSHFLDFWSQSKDALFGNRPWTYLAYVGVLIAGMWASVLRRSTASRWCLALPAFILSSMIVLSLFTVLFDAVDTGRHLFLFNTLLDVTVFGVITLS